ncbi:MAG TPA: polysaccharide deacetylase family protein [Bacteroidales bacterium]|nr:polysaccharide deacetylase family protein [Bacteroidales bacterium]
MNILTFDIEEWFHILDNDSTRSEKQWSRYESRIHNNTERIFGILERHRLKATFFCLGWIARKYPEIIKRIDRAGFEVACHSSMHQLVYEQTPEQFRHDLMEGLSILEDTIGKKVITYRAPGFSITENCKWAFEILAENGIQNDSSVFPAERLNGGLPTYAERNPSLIRAGRNIIREFPINTKKILGKPFVFSGGGYFRLFPYFLIKKWTSETDYVMSYLHPRDFDHDQPVIEELPAGRKFRSYIGLKGAERKLSKWLSDFEFIDMRTAAKRINWNEARVINLEVTKVPELEEVW